MTLPEHLDYDEASVELDGIPEYYPLVRCTVSGCLWTYPADWAELGDDEYGADWAALHPMHEPTVDGSPMFYDVVAALRKQHGRPADDPAEVAAKYPPGSRMRIVTYWNGRPSWWHPIRRLRWNRHPIKPPRWIP